MRTSPSLPNFMHVSVGANCVRPQPSAKKRATKGRPYKISRDIVFSADLSVFCQFDLRTVEDAGPYRCRWMLKYIFLDR